MSITNKVLYAELIRMRKEHAENMRLVQMTAHNENLNRKRIQDLEDHLADLPQRPSPEQLFSFEPMAEWPSEPSVARLRTASIRN